MRTTTTVPSVSTTAAVRALACLVLAEATFRVANRKAGKMTLSDEDDDLAEQVRRLAKRSLREARAEADGHDVLEWTETRKAAHQALRAAHPDMSVSGVEAWAAAWLDANTAPEPELGDGEVKLARISEGLVVSVIAEVPGEDTETQVLILRELGTDGIWRERERRTVHDEYESAEVLEDWGVEPIAA